MSPEASGRSSLDPVRSRGRSGPASGIDRQRAARRAAIRRLARPDVGPEHRTRRSPPGIKESAMSRAKFLPTRRRRAARPSRRIPLLTEALEDRRSLSAVSIVATTLPVGPGAGRVRPCPTVRQRPRPDDIGRAASRSRLLIIVRDQSRTAQAVRLRRVAMDRRGPGSACMLSPTNGLRLEQRVPGGGLNEPFCADCALLNWRTEFLPCGGPRPLLRVESHVARFGPTTPKRAR